MTTAQTTYGPVEGVYEGSLHIFKSIPYAAPPLGEQRWLPPTPPEPWTEVRDATQFSSVAPQNPIQLATLSAFNVGDDMSEDCLTLSVFTPGLDPKGRPVMVWIHGGGFMIGSGSQAIYSGEHLAAKGDVVVVTINYRLGALGFVNLAEVTGGQIPATGNEGLLDQVAALEWVRDNIANFGGDPGNVTIFGESAGGMSVGALLAMQSARGLFHKAIPQSGACHTANPKERSIRIAERFLRCLGSDPNDPQALRQVPWQEILKAQAQAALPDDEQPDVAGMPFQPCIDGQVLTSLPIETLRAGSGAEVPLLVGTTLDEWKLLAPGDPSIYDLDKANLRKKVEATIGSAAPEIIEKYTKSLEARGAPTTPTEILLAIETDRIFRLPALRLAEAQRDRGTPVYNYLFTWESPAMGGMLGACHALELCFVFGTIDSSKSRAFSGSGPAVDTLQEAMMEAWLAFARTGNPSNSVLGDWPVYGAARETMILGAKSGIEAAPYETERLAWEGIERVGTL